MNFAWHLPTGLIAIAVMLDILLGDLEQLPHPVQLIGQFIALGDRFLHSGRNRLDLWLGGLLTAVTVASAAGITWLVISKAANAAPLLSALIATLVAWTTLALRGLDRAAARVERALIHDDLEQARRLMPALVGRDPQRLDRNAIIRATIESIAENSSDAVVAPLFYLLVGGPVAAMAYKAINTLDSMIGYTDARHLYFGRCAARLDDLANFVPARISGLALVAAAQLFNHRGNQAWMAMRNDASRHLSPNAGYPEAAMAGALGVQLGGAAVYRSEVEMRAYLGRPDRPVHAGDIRNARWLLWTQCLIAFLFMTALRALVGMG